jgi:hypothetical protein
MLGNDALQEVDSVPDPAGASAAAADCPNSARERARPLHPAVGHGKGELRSHVRCPTLPIQVRIRRRGAKTKKTGA